MSGRHLKPQRRHPGRLAAAAVGVAAIAAVITGASAPTSTSAAFTDTAKVTTTTTAYTVPTVIAGGAEVSGTGQSISTRLRASCDAPSGVRWRWRDHMVAWGDVWNPWQDWRTDMSAPGWTGWSTSDLIAANLVAEVEWEVQCGASTWTSTTQLHGPLGIVRTT